MDLVLSRVHREPEETSDLCPSRIQSNIRYLPVINRDAVYEIGIFKRRTRIGVGHRIRTGVPDALDMISYNDKAKTKLAILREMQ